ncbi:MAG: retropepsin-like aspartic protease, partial [Cyanobacteria bacterium J06641_5]
MLATFATGAIALPGHPVAAEPAEPALDPEALVQELQACLGARAQGPDAPDSLAALQALSLECLYSTLIVTPDGRIRPDASTRLETLVTAAGLELPTAQSRGSATADLSLIPESNLFALDVTIQEQSLNFLLDTGASNSLLEATALARLDLAGTPVPPQLLEYLVVGDECDRLQAQIVNLPAISVQTAQVSGITSIGLAQSPVFDTTEADGVLGLDFLQGFDTTIDPAARQLHLAPPSGPNPDAIPLEGRLGVMVTAVYVNGQGPYQFLLDTGASRSVISPTVARSAQIPTGSPVEIQGFCGPETGSQARLDRLRIEDFAATDLDALILESEVLQLLGVDGIVGQNFLSRYR